MATQAQLIKKAFHEMEQASITPEEWCKRIEEGYPPGIPYKYKRTHNYKAQQYLFKAANTPNPRPAPPRHLEHVSVKPINLASVQRCLFLTGDISRALECKARLLIATADPGYRHFYTHSFLQNAIAQDRLRVWCDCRQSPDGTPPKVALAWLKELGLPPDYFYGQGETAEEFQRGYDAGARKLIVNMSVLTDSQLSKVDSGECVVTNETYFNVDRHYGVNWRLADGVGSNTMAVYASVREGATYYSLEEQYRDGKYNPDVDCLYVAGFTDQDWQFAMFH